VVKEVSPRRFKWNEAIARRRLRFGAFTIGCARRGYDSRKRVSEVCLRDPVADGLRNWMLIKLLICKGYSEASPVTWDYLEIHGMERRCRLTYDTSTECNLVRDNVGVYCANGSFATASRVR
jgi:hypothetical protein